jgi:VIT1/CCC1 family predicted Fe2+/Mn2+ transporter
MRPEQRQISATEQLLAELRNELAAAIVLIERLDDAIFTEPSGRNGSIGAHFRHNIELVKALYYGVETGSVDYAARSRDRTIETDRSAAIRAFQSLIERGREFASLDISTPLSVASESVPGLDIASSFGRELEFAISHTVHHHALIAERLREMCVGIDSMFGVAAATRRFWETENNKNKTE